MFYKPGDPTVLVSLALIFNNPLTTLPNIQATPVDIFSHFYNH